MRFTRETIVLMSLFAASPAYADRRHFAFTYEPKTLSAKELELEYYMTSAITRDRLADAYRFAWGHQVELEYGVTDHFDLSMYQMFSADAWTGYKLRARYRPFLTGELPVDGMLYAELIHHSSGKVSLEQKVVLGKMIGPWILSLDSTVEEGPLGDTLGFSWSESLAVGYEVARWLSVGVETQLRMRWRPKTVYTSPDPVLEAAEPLLYVGPTLSFSAMKVWWDVSIAVRAHGDEDDAQMLLRVLWGVYL